MYILTLVLGVESFENSLNRPLHVCYKATVKLFTREEQHLCLSFKSSKSHVEKFICNKPCNQVYSARSELCMLLTADLIKHTECKNPQRVINPIDRGLSSGAIYCPEGMD